MRLRTWWAALRSASLLLILWICVLPFRSPYPPDFEGYTGHPFGPGNAPDSTRAEILQRLIAFQEAYADRDLSRAGGFTRDLFSQRNTLVLGTMPQEVLLGVSRVERLIRADWASWGDCTFFLDGTHVSTEGGVAWIATVGFVAFDLSRFLVLPLRLTGVLVNENGIWRFQQLQYQFDLDLSAHLVLILLLLLLSAGSVVQLLGRISLSFMKRRKDCGS